MQKNGPNHYVEQALRLHRAYVYQLANINGRSEVQKLLRRMNTAWTPLVAHLILLNALELNHKTLPDTPANTVFDVYAQPDTYIYQYQPIKWPGASLFVFRQGRRRATM